MGATGTGSIRPTLTADDIKDLAVLVVTLKLHVSVQGQSADRLAIDPKRRGLAIGDVLEATGVVVDEARLTKIRALGVRCGHTYRPHFI